MYWLVLWWILLFEKSKQAVFEFQECNLILCTKVFKITTLFPFVFRPNFQFHYSFESMNLLSFSLKLISNKQLRCCGRKSAESEVPLIIDRLYILVENSVNQSIRDIYIFSIKKNNFIPKFKSVWFYLEILNNKSSK